MSVNVESTGYIRYAYGMLVSNPLKNTCEAIWKSMGYKGALL